MNAHDQDRSEFQKAISSSDTIRVVCDKHGLPFETSFAPRTDLPPGLVEGAEQPPENLGEGKWRLWRYCPYCLNAHDFMVTLDPSKIPPTRKETPSNEPDFQPVFKLNTQKSLMTTPARQEPESRSFTEPAHLLTGLEKLRESFRPTPADASLAFQEGARMARSDDPDEMKRSLSLLKRARKIYQANNRVRDAAYAAVVLGDTLFKLGRSEEALAELAFAEGGLLKEDHYMLERVRRLKSEIRPPPEQMEHQR